MAHFELRSILAILVIGACSCAAPLHDSPPGAPAAPTTPRPDTALTGAEVPSSVASPSPEEALASPARWTDEQILDAVLAAENGRANEAKLARTFSHSARVERFAQDLRGEARELEQAESLLPRAVAPSELRARVEEARRGTAEALRGAGASVTFDRQYITAEIDYDRALLQLLDQEMIPSATAQPLREYLQMLRSKTASSLLAAEQIAWNLL